MKKYLIIFSFILMPVLGFYVFHWWLSHQKADPYALIPGNAFAVVYTQNFYSNWDSLENSNLWKNLQGLPNLATKDQRMNSLYSLYGSKKKVEAFFKSKKVLISLHLTNATEFDYLFFIPVTSAEDEVFNDLIKKIASDTSYLIEDRQYEDLSVKEISKKSDKSSFSFVRYKDLLICSYTGVLIEDVIRVIKEEGTDNFIKENPKVKNSPYVGSETFVYINYRNLSGLASVFSDSTEFFKPLNNYADHSSLDFKMGRKDIRLSGFTTATENNFLNVFKGQKPQTFNLKSIIPNNTSSFYHFGFDNGVALNESLVKYWRKCDSSVIEDRKDLYDLYNIDFETIFSEFGNEIGLSILEPEKPGKAPGKLLFIKSNNTNRFFLHLNKIVTLAKEDSRDTLYNEQYHGYHIREMNVTEFPHVLLGEYFHGFAKCYYVVMGDCMVFSDDPKNIRQLSDNIDSENVWSKTAVINTMLENNFSPSNVSFFIDTEKSWKNILKHASADIKIQIQNNMEELKQIHHTLIQYKVVNDKIFTSLIIDHNLDQEILNIDNAYVSENTISMDKGVFSEPYLFSYKDHNEIIVQDSAFQLYAVSNGIVLWSDTLGKAISGTVLSVDMEKNGDPAYFGLAQNVIFAYGKNGVPVPGFPIILPDTVILNTLSLIDFDHTRNYRLVVSDQSGHLYMFDTKGNPIAGWKPLSLHGKLNHGVKHLRIKGKDIIIALQENGKIWALNTKGEFYKGFPLDLKANSSSPVFIEGDESSAENSFLTVLSDKGEIIKIDLKGSIIKREKVNNLSPGASFKLCLNQSEDSYVIVTQSKNELSVLNDKSDEVCDMILNTVNMDLGYYTRSDKSLFVIFDRDANLCYLMDDKGKNIFKSAVKGTKPLKISFNGSKVFIVKTYQYQLEEGSLQ